MYQVCVVLIGAYQCRQLIAQYVAVEPSPLQHTGDHAFRISLLTIMYSVFSVMAGLIVELLFILLLCSLFFLSTGISMVQWKRCHLIHHLIYKSSFKINVSSVCCTDRSLPVLSTDCSVCCSGDGAITSTSISMVQWK